MSDYSVSERFRRTVGDEQADLMESAGNWLDEQFPNSIIRVIDNGGIELALNAPDMDGRYKLDPDDVPGSWYIDDVRFGEGGVSFILRQEEVDRAPNAKIVNSKELTEARSLDASDY